MGLFLILGLFLNGCGTPPAPQPQLGGSESTNASVEGIVDANNRFALELYSQYKSHEGNIFFSPYSVFTALSMTYEGARGKTAEEMQTVLHIPRDANSRRAAIASLYNTINKDAKSYKLLTANALWAQKGYPFLQEYFNVITKYYGGKVTNLDFQTQTEKSRQIINKWVEDKTNAKIKNLVPQGVITSETRLVLTNAIYFKGEWLKAFDKEGTVEDKFWVTPSSSVNVEMMSRVDEEAMFNYTETDTLQMLELPYSGEKLSMLILLPKNEDLDALESALSVEKLEALKERLIEQRVKVFIPKFKLETKYFMRDTLSDMGMSTAFSLSADFSGMTGGKDIFISDVIHQAFVEVNEEGTEAAAATAVVMKETAFGPGALPRIPVFRANHPFVFIIQERDTGLILFMGRVMNPTQ
ncbi:serpin family protein [Candidatus Woesearchaeota archaeon]|nr:serpin family protein [Candidatus Woesearchaeota archaeon]RLE41419.1 MAG: serpin family protein [Candidatus Woesearchaeota archaeon]